MLGHYSKTTLRILRRHPGFSLINIGGLSVAVAVAALLLLFAKTEWTYDTFHEESDRIHRVWVQEDWGPDQQFFNTITPIRVGPTVLDQIPEVEAWARYDRVQTTVQSGTARLSETAFMVDPTFFSIFDFETIEGPADIAFDTPDQIVLTRSSRDRYFGEANAVGEVLQLEVGDDVRTFSVTAVVEDPPQASSIQFSVLLPYSLAADLYRPGMFDAWFNVSPETYALLRDGVSTGNVEASMATIIANERVGGDQEVVFTLGLQPLTDIHLNPDFPLGYGAVANPVYVFLLAGIAILLLLIAAINFVTLTISRSFGRAREIGVRKSVGASRGQLMGQYWGESLVVTGLAVVIGFVLADALAPVFSNLSGQAMSVTFSGTTIGLGVMLFVLIALTAGVYPAAVLSGLGPVDALHGRVSGQLGQQRLRRILVMAQFGLSIILLVGAGVVQQQLRFMEKADLGFSPNRIVYVSTTLGSGDTFALAERLRTETESRTDLGNVASSLITFNENGWGRGGYTATDGTYKRLYLNIVDEAFIPTMNLKMVEGRNFSFDEPADRVSAIIVNQALVDAYGWDDPLNEQLPGDWASHRIIGVVQDFHYAPLHEAIQPAVMAINSGMLFSGISDFDYDGGLNGKVFVELTGTDVQAALAGLADIWARVAPDVPYVARFVDQDVEAQYRQEQRVARLALLGSILAIFIAGLGLLGLSAIVVAQRTKEIGVRRVLGASATGIVGLFFREFSMLVGLAFLVAMPLALYGTQAWLDTFAYRIDMGPWPFVAAAVIVFGVTGLTVSAQALRAVLGNPVKSLRSE